MIPFGPQLIGQTEKTLSMILDKVLTNAAVSEHEWVTLRLAEQAPPGQPLVDFARSRSLPFDVASVLAELTDRGLLDDGRLTTEGSDFVTSTSRVIAEVTAPIWADLPEADVASATRVLNAVLSRGRAVVTG